MEIICIYLKPRVKALLDLHPTKRGPHWLEEVAAAVFDLQSWEEVTPEQRSWTKPQIYAYSYGMGAAAMIDAFNRAAPSAEAADRAIRSWNELVARRAAPANLHEALAVKLALKTPVLKAEVDKRTRQSSKTGATWPKPKGSY